MHQHLERWYTSLIKWKSRWSGAQWLEAVDNLQIFARPNILPKHRSDTVVSNHHSHLRVYSKHNRFLKRQTERGLTGGVSFTPSPTRFVYVSETYRSGKKFAHLFAIEFYFSTSLLLFEEKLEKEKRSNDSVFNSGGLKVSIKYSRGNEFEKIVTLRCLRIEILSRG